MCRYKVGRWEMSGRKLQRGGVARVTGSPAAKLCGGQRSEKVQRGSTGCLVRPYCSPVGCCSRAARCCWGRLNC